MPVLMSALDDQEAMRWAIHALAKFGPAAKDAIPALERISNGGEGSDNGQRKEKVGETLPEFEGHDSSVRAVRPRYP